MIVAGEPSGDLQASRVAVELKEIAPDLEILWHGRRSDGGSRG